MPPDVGLEEGLLPLRRMGVEESEDVEEERRLFYVAVTRAEEQLYLTRCVHRRIYGNTAYRNSSRFLEGIDSDLVVIDPAGAASSRPSPSSQFSPPRKSAPKKDYDGIHYEYDQVPSDGLRFTQPSRDDSELGSLVGRRAMHKTFGSGLVTDAEYAGERVKLTIKFRDYGTKKVIRSFVEIV